MEMFLSCRRIVLVISNAVLTSLIREQRVPSHSVMHVMNRWAWMLVMVVKSQLLSVLGLLLPNTTDMARLL